MRLKKIAGMILSFIKDKIKCKKVNIMRKKLELGKPIVSWVSTSDLYKCVNLLLRDYVSGCYMFEVDIFKNLLKKEITCRKNK
jgi:hypothetical protein